VNLIAHLPDLFADAPAAKAPTPDRQFVASPSYFTMHPQLSDKKIICKEFIEALEQCHNSGWSKFLGACNSQKDALNRCLRTEVCLSLIARPTAHTFQFSLAYRSNYPE
jgi:diketogulonate reductase-like aldo/keto reductase